MESFWTASERGASPVVGVGADVEVEVLDWGAAWVLVVVVDVRRCGGRRCRLREKSGEGKTVRALTRMLVIVSSRERCGLNW